ncbi:MAG: hypothetical protein ACO3RV_02300 [Luteolibacter sp.]
MNVKSTAHRFRLVLLTCLLGGLCHATTIYTVSFSTGELITYQSEDPVGSRSVLLTGGSLVSPSSITLGPDGNLYIGESGDGSTFAPRISKFEVSSLTLSTVYAFSGFELFPGSLVFAGNDLIIGRNPFFSDTGPALRLTNATGGALAISDYSTGGSLASSPGIAISSDGSFFVSDQTYNFSTGIASGPVKRFDASGNYVGELIADGADGLAGPTGLVISGDNLFTASVMTGTILKTDLTSDSTEAFADTGAPFEAGTLAALADGTLLVGSTSGNGNIYHFDTDGTLKNTFASGLGQIGGITAVPEPSSALLGILGLLPILRRKRAAFMNAR